MLASDVPKRPASRSVSWSRQAAMLPLHRYPSVRDAPRARISMRHLRWRPSSGVHVRPGARAAPSVLRTFFTAVCFESCGTIRSLERRAFGPEGCDAQGRDGMDEPEERRA